MFTVREIYETFSNFVSIEGVIKNPGEYEMYENMTLADLILQAGGVDKNVRNINVEISNARDETLFNSKGPIKIADVKCFYA